MKNLYNDIIKDWIESPLWEKIAIILTLGLVFYSVFYAFS